MKHAYFVPYPTYSDDKHIFFELEILYCSVRSNKVIGRGSAILARATMTEEERLSYCNFYLFDENLLDEVDDEDALMECSKVSKVIWG